MAVRALLPSSAGPAVQQYWLEGGEGVLGDGVVPAGAGLAHALADVPIGEPTRSAVVKTERFQASSRLAASIA
jgi:hypothetical protein